MSFAVAAGAIVTALGNPLADCWQVKVLDVPVVDIVMVGNPGGTTVKVALVVAGTMGNI